MLPKEYYLKSVRRPYAPIFASLIFSGFACEKHYRPIVEGPFAMRNVVLCNGQWYYSKEEYAKAGTLAFASWQDPFTLARVKRIFTKRAKRLIAAAAGETFETYALAYEAYMPALAHIFTSEEYVETALRSALLKHTSMQNAERLMSALNMPLADNFYKKEARDLVRAVNLKEHVKEYEWISSRYGEISPYTIAEASHKRVELLKDRFVEHSLKEKKQVRRAVEEGKRMLGKESFLIDLMQFIIYYRTHRTDIMNKSQYLLAPLLKRIADEASLRYDEIIYATKTEMLTELPNAEVLGSRREAFSMVMEDGRIRCVEGKEHCMVQNIFADERGAEVTELKGATACRGIARGRAKIILSSLDFVKLTEGDILITSMTTPQMGLMLHKAAGIVTEEGGITCHAAIISRELRKPCVMGVKNVLEVLRDGDMVEVDAERGVVKKCYV